MVPYGAIFQSHKMQHMTAVYMAGLYICDDYMSFVVFASFVCIFHVIDFFLTAIKFNPAFKFLFDIGGKMKRTFFQTGKKAQTQK